MTEFCERCGRHPIECGHEPDPAMPSDLSTIRIDQIKIGDCPSWQINIVGPAPLLDMDVGVYPTLATAVVAAHSWEMPIFIPAGGVRG